MPKLISEAYQKLNYELHRTDPTFGSKAGEKFGEAVSRFATAEKISTVLDYGCGKGTLKQTLATIRPDLQVSEYDPAVPGKTAKPSPAELVTCFDVMEHIEPDKLDEVLSHIQSVTLRRCIMLVCTCAATKVLADGRNAHLIVQSGEWWRDRLGMHFDVKSSAQHSDEEVIFVLSPKH